MEVRAELTQEDLDRHKPDLVMPPISRECAPDYWRYVESGEQLAADTHLTILGLCRNAMPFIDINVKRMQRLVSAFRSWHGYIYENDSEDGTDECLQNWSVALEELAVESVKNGRPQLSHEKSTRRTDAMAEYRQRCVEWARKREPAGRHVVAVVDFDAWGGWSDTGVMTGLHWLEQLPDAAGLASVSTTDMPVPQHPHGKYTIHYDGWAFRLNYWTEHEQPWFPHWFPPVGSDPVPCRSAFGGMALYRPEAFFAGEYSGGDCEHVHFHKSIADRTGLRMYLNPSQRLVMSWLPEARYGGGQHGDD